MSRGGFARDAAETGAVPLTATVPTLGERRALIDADARLHRHARTKRDIGRRIVEAIYCTRWTTLTKLPVAFSAGSSEKAVPDPGCTLATCPSTVRSE